MDEKQSFNIILEYFKYRGVVGYQLKSFNNLVNFGLQNIIDQEANISITPKRGQKYEVSFGHVWVAPPQVIEENRKIYWSSPADARIRDLTYNSAVHCDITETFINEKGEKDETIHNRIVLGRIPVMLKSERCNLYNLTPEKQTEMGECPNDPGGYFVIQGKERVLVGQIRAVYNKVFVIKQKRNDKYKYIAEVRSMSEETGHSVLLKAMIGADDRKLCFSLPYITEVIPIGIVFKAMGYTDDQDIKDLIGLDLVNTRKYIRIITRDAYFINTKEEALEYIGKHSLHTIPKENYKKYAWQVVETELLPHLGISGSIKEKACFLGQMVNKLLTTSVGLRSQDDRDNYANRRVEISGILIYDLFRTLFKRFVSELKTKLEKKKQRPDVISTISRMKGVITKGLQLGFTSGNWGAYKNAYVKTGVSQILDRMTWPATISHLHRLNIPIGKEGKNMQIRQIHSSQAGLICPAETPEGKSAGIALNATFMADFSRKIQSILVKEILEKFEDIISIDDVKINQIRNMTRLFLNGALIGYTQNPEDVVDYVRNMRNKGQLDKEVSVSYDEIDEDIHMYCDEGRMIRPLLTMNNNALLIKNKKYTWIELLRKNYIQYLDSSEIESCVIAMYPTDINIQHNDFCEIHPVVMLGVIAAMIPFPDHSQSPRNCYQASMGKQAIGVPVLSSQKRADTLLYMLHYPQRPLVTTKLSDMMGYNKMPSGVNAIVAIISAAFNQEDSIVINKSAIERGMFILTQYKNVDESEKKCDTYSTEKICCPPMSTGKEVKDNDSRYFKRKYANYSMLEKNCTHEDCSEDSCHPSCRKGIVKLGMHVKKGDVLVGKIITKNSKTGEISRTDVSRITQDDEGGIIDRIFASITPNGYKLVKVVIRNEKIPEVGDKFASRAAQKGTVGMVYNQHELPFTEDGIVPDIIINPHCIPSRMTVNQLIECALGKVAAISGDFGDATPFTHYSVNVADKVCSKLEELGYQEHKKGRYLGTPIEEFKHGWERMYGSNGEELEAKIFIGPTYYQRLKHMVSNKMHARANGRITQLTRQPLEGRSRDGGLRFGEMERDCMLAHGTSSFIQERLFKVSDPYTAPVCMNPDCGQIAASTAQCHSCGGDSIEITRMPYATKLLIQELQAMNLKIIVHPSK